MPTPTSQLLSRTIYTTDGTTTNWNFSFSGGYIDAEHVEAFYINPADDSITFVTGTLIGPFQLQISPAIAAGMQLVISRNTPKDLPLVDFVEGGGLTELALDTANKQAVFGLAELLDTAGTADVDAAVIAAEQAEIARVAAEAAAANAIAAAGSLNTQQIFSFVAEGVVASANLGVSPDERNTMVYINGVYQNKDTYTIVGSTLTLDAVPASGSLVEVVINISLDPATLAAFEVDAAAASAAAVTATTQAGIATTQAGIATTAASTATTQAGTATTQANVATTGANTATTQAGIATGAASTATTQAGTATTAASTATTQAGLAAGSASTALGHANTASTSASTATTQANLAVASFDAFDDRYLGSKASDPTLDNDSNTLLEGALYWNSASKQIRVYDGAAWAVAYLPASGYVTLTGTETLTNKTLVAPVLGVATGTSFNAITGLSAALPIVAGTAAIGAGTTAARHDHVHPAQTSVTGNAGTVTNATLTTALTVNTGTVGLVGNAANNSVLTLGAGASSVSGVNTGNQTITLTGGVTGSGTGSFAATVVTNANLTGEVTSVGNATTVPNGTVIGKVLTGYVSGAGTVAATDTILQAVNKLNGNTGLKANTASPTFTGTVGLPAYTETVFALSGTDIAPINGTVQTRTLAGNVTFTESIADGQSVVLMLNPATFTTTWPTISWVNAAGSAAAPTLKASVVNVIVLWQVAGVLYGNWIGSM